MQHGDYPKEIRLTREEYMTLVEENKTEKFLKVRKFDVYYMNIKIKVID